MSEKFPNLGEEKYIQFQEAQKNLKKRNSKKYTLRKIIIKLSKVKAVTILKAQEKATCHVQRNLIIQEVGFSAETLQARRVWDKELKEKKLPTKKSISSNSVLQK